MGQIDIKEPEIESSGFVIDSDSKADWAVEKIKENRAERDRLLKIIEEKKVELQLKADKITQEYSGKESHLLDLLDQYMATVECKETKTQCIYKLVSGSLVMKKPARQFVRDDGTLLAWSKANATDYIKVKESVDWAGLKKLLTVSGETVIRTDTGEPVEGVTAEWTDPVFDIK